MNNITLIAQIGQPPKSQKTYPQQNESIKIDFNTTEILWNTSTSRKKESMKFDCIYKYIQGDAIQIKKCVKQIHKQVLLPKIIQTPQFNMIIPLYESNQTQQHMLAHKKVNLMYYVIKDLMEMYQETSLTSYADKTPRNQISLEIYELSEECSGSGLVAKLEIYNASQAISILEQHMHSRQRSSMKLYLKYKNITANFTLLREGDMDRPIMMRMLRSDLQQFNHTFLMYHHEIDNQVFANDIANFKWFTQQLQDTGSSSKKSNQNDLIMNLQTQIQELKTQLNSQTDLIQKLCVQQKSTNILSNRKRKSIHSKTKTKKPGHFAKAISHSRKGSQDYDSVIIEDQDGEEDTQNESKFNGELSIVAAAANNQGDTHCDIENSTQVIEDLSLLRKLSLEINRNYEKFAEFRKSLNFFNNSKGNGNESVIIRQSLTGSSGCNSLVNQRSESNIAAEVEKQFKSLLEQRLIQSQKEKQLIEEALLKQQLQCKGMITEQYSTRNSNQNLEIERILTDMNKALQNACGDAQFKSTQSTFTNKHKKESNHISEVLESEESFDIGEESIAYEGCIQNNLQQINLRNIPKGQEPSKLIDHLNQAQQLNRIKQQSKVPLPPKNAQKIMKLYKTDVPLNNGDTTDRSQRLPQFMDRSQRINNIQNYSNRIGTTQNFYQTSTILSSNPIVLKARPKSKQGPQSATHSQKQNLTQSFKMSTNPQHQKLSLDIHRVPKHSAKNNSLSGSISYQAIAQTAASALKNLNSKIQDKKRQSEQRGSTERCTGKISTVIEESMEPEKVSRSPSIKDERASIQALERPKGFLMNEKNCHQLYFKLQSNDPSKRNSVAQSPMMTHLNINNNANKDNNLNNSGDQNIFPRMNIQKKNRQVMGEQMRSLDNGEKAMIAKFYHNQPKSPVQELSEGVMSNSKQSNLQSQKKLTDLKEARMKNRSESRQNASKQSLVQSQSMNNYNSLTRSGINNSSQLQGLNNNSSTLDETIQVVKDMLQIKRNQSHTNVTQLLPNSNLYAAGNQSQLGINASVLFDKSASQIDQSHNMLSSGIISLKKPPIKLNKAIIQGKENLDEFFQMYETFKQQNSGSKKHNTGIMSPEESKRSLFQSNSNQSSRLFLANALQNNSNQQLLRQRSTSEYNYMCNGYSANYSSRQLIQQQVMGKVKHNLQKEL